MLLAISGFAFFLSRTDGPFNLLATARNLLARVPLLGPAVCNVLSCDFCLGAWAGTIMYLGTTTISSWSMVDLVVWALGSAISNLVLMKIIQKL